MPDRRRARKKARAPAPSPPAAPAPGTSCHGRARGPAGCVRARLRRPALQAAARRRGSAPFCGPKCAGRAALAQQGDCPHRPAGPSSGRVGSRVGRSHDARDVFQAPAAGRQFAGGVVEKAPAQGVGGAHAAVHGGAAARGEQDALRAVVGRRAQEFAGAEGGGGQGMAFDRARSRVSPLAEAVSTSAVLSNGNHANPASTHIAARGAGGGRGNPFAGAGHAISAAAVPSPPSASGNQDQSRGPVRSSDSASAAMRHASAALKLPLKESKARTTFMAGA
jgi:hypothetical protein